MRNAVAVADGERNGEVRFIGEVDMGRLGLARLLRARELTVVWVPDTGHEAMRDLVRAVPAPDRETPLWVLSGQSRG